MQRLLVHLRHVSRQSTLPRCDDVEGFFFKDLKELPQIEFPQPYLGRMRFGPAFVDLLDVALTMDLVGKAGELPKDFEPPVYEGLLLDAIKASKERDFRSAIFYSAIAIETLAGTCIEEEHQRLLGETPAPAHIRAVECQEGKKGKFEDPVYKYLRDTGRFPNLLHELPLYVMKKSLKLEAPEVYNQARKLYQTRNSLAHRGEPKKHNALLPVGVSGAVAALECASQVFAWFGVPGKWSIPFARAWKEWGAQNAGG
jgi:hypothetical protein